MSTRTRKYVESDTSVRATLVTTRDTARHRSVSHNRIESYCARRSPPLGKTRPRASAFEALYESKCPRAAEAHDRRRQRVGSAHVGTSIDARRRQRIRNGMHTCGFMQRLPASKYRTIVSTSRVSVRKARRRREDTHRSVSTQLRTKPRTFRSYVSAFPRCFLTRISCELARAGVGVTRYDGCTAATDIAHRRARAIFASLTARMRRAHRRRNVIVARNARRPQPCVCRWRAHEEPLLRKSVPTVASVRGARARETRAMASPCPSRDISLVKHHSRVANAGSGASHVHKRRVSRTMSKRESASCTRTNAEA